MTLGREGQGRSTGLSLCRLGLLKRLTNEANYCRTRPSANTIACATVPCNPGQNCTYTQGYWKNHSDVWPLQSLTLGVVSYDASQLLQILNRPAQDNGLVILAHQLIAAKLNIANGADPTAVQPTVIDADRVIGGLIVPTIGNGFLSPGETSNLTETLTDTMRGLLALDTSMIDVAPRNRALDFQF